MTPLVAVRPADVQQAALIAVDAERCEYFALLASGVDDAPEPRRWELGEAEASCLRAELRHLTKREIREVRVTPHESDLWGHVCTVMAIGVCNREVPLPGRHGEVLALLGHWFPIAPWTTTLLDYDVRAGVLAEHALWVPPCLRGGSGG